MRAVRAAVRGLGLAGILALTAGTALAQEQSAIPSESPAALVPTPAPADLRPGQDPAGEPVSSAAASAVPPADDLVLPEPPEAPVTITAGDALRPAEPRDDLGLPALPEAGVVITAEDRLRGEILTLLPQIDRIATRLPKKDREALGAYYASHPPVFVSGSGWTHRGASVIDRLKAADEDGLDPADYPVPAFSRKVPTEADWADAELRLAALAVAYARDARGARVDPVKLSALVTPKLYLPAAEAVVEALASASDAGAALDAYNPPHPGYRALKARLADLRASHPAAPMVRVPPGRALKVGMRDPRVPLIRARFNLGPAEDQNTYDERVASAVAEFQREKGLTPNGVLTPQTVALLSGPSPARLEAELIANMERWRWLPPDLGGRHIAVNVPEFRLRLYDDGQIIHQTKVIVGKTETPTPIFSDEMETVIVNPTWHVPPSILKKEFLPGLAQDPLYAERRGFRVIRRGNSISVQQPPGERNALGYVKFIFPNQHSVYLHDTPNRNLFAAARRAFSHGCVRVEQPFRLAEVLLSHEGPWTEPKLRGLIGKGERYIRLKQTLPVHLTYFTASIDEAGQMHRFDDLYGLDRKVKAALNLAE